jgi:predicted ArsR family transcriptional regulator
MHKTPNDPEPIQVLAKVARDTCSGGFTFDTVELIFQQERISRSDIVKQLSIPKTRVHRMLTELQQTGVIKKVTTQTGRGRPTDLYSLTPRMKTIMEAIEP